MDVILIILANNINNNFAKLVLTKSLFYRKVPSSPNLMEKLQNQKPTKSKKVKSKLKTNKTKCIMTKRSLSLTQFRARPQKRPKAAHRNQIGERKRNLIVKHLVYREIIEEATIGKNIY